MKLEISYNKKQTIYQEQLNTISDIKFTLREIDIIACILHNRGVKKIASLLLISPRTVNSHVHNIMLKLGHSSREYIIDFIEKSDKMLFVKQYYLQTLIQSSFHNALIKITNTINKQGITCIVNCKQVSTEEQHILDQLTEHLQLANITLIDVAKTTEEIRSNLYILTNELLIRKNYQKSILLLLDETNNPLNYKNIECIDFRQEENYYFAVLQLLKIIINQNSIKQIIQEFKKEYQSIENSWEKGTTVEKPFSLFFFFKEKLKYKYFIFLILCFVCFITFTTYNIIQKVFLTSETQNLNKDKIRMDLPLPHEDILLKHSSTLDKIKQKLTDKNGMEKNHVLYNYHYNYSC